MMPDEEEGMDELGEAVEMLGYMIVVVMLAVLIVCAALLQSHWGAA